MVIIPGIIQFFPRRLGLPPGQRLGGQRSRRWGWLSLAVSFGLVVPLGVGNGSVRGEIVTVGYDDFGFDPLVDSISDIDAEGLPQLSEAEQERLDMLLSARQPQILSDVSPNGSALVVGLVDRLNPENRSIHFLDLNTGELIQSPELEQQVFSPHLPIRWISNDVLRFAQEDPYGSWEIVTFNRRTGILSRTVVQPTQVEEGEILGLSPDFSKLVIRVYEGEEDAIYVVFLSSLNRTEVARLPEGLEIPAPAWSADGDRMALVTASIEQRRLYDRTPFSPNLSSPVMQDALGRVAPEDNLFRQRSEVRVFDFSQPEPLQFELTAAADASEFFADANLSSDGELLLVKLFKPALVQRREHPSYLFPDRAFYRVYEGEEDAIYVVFLSSLNRTEVARLPEGLEIPTPAWSADGDRMALVTASIEQRRLYDRTPFSPNLSSPVMQDALGRVAPEDNLFRQRSEVRVFDFSQPEPLQFELTAAADASEFFADASLSSDGELLLVKLFKPALVQGREHPSYLFPDRAFYRVYDATGQVKETISFDQLSGPIESGGQLVGTSQDPNQHILFWGAAGIDRHFFLYELGSNRLEPLPLPSGAVDGDAIAISARGDKVIYGFSAVTQPPELFSLALPSPTQPTPLTSVNQELAAVNQVRMDPVSFSTSNGLRQGFLVQPADAPFPPQSGPLVFWQEGGPGFSMSNQFATEVEIPLNLLPNFGIPVLVVALTGREGYGPGLYRSQADGQNFGQIDLLEGMEIVGQLVRDGWTTPDQVGITGCSYGGYFAGQIIARYPDLFAAANPQCSLLDTLTEWQLGYSSLLSYLVGQTPMENPERYIQISPLYQAEQIRTPTIMFHGSDDFLQIDVARNFHDVVEASGVPITLYQFEGVGHSLYNPDYQRIAAQIQIDFFRQYLGQGE